MIPPPIQMIINLHFSQVNIEVIASSRGPREYSVVEYKWHISVILSFPLIVPFLCLFNIAMVKGWVKVRQVYRIQMKFVGLNIF